MNKHETRSSSHSNYCTLDGDHPTNSNSGTSCGSDAASAPNSKYDPYIEPFDENSVLSGESSPLQYGSPMSTRSAPGPMFEHVVAHEEREGEEGDKATSGGTSTLKKVGIFQMVFIAYAFTAAGPFGLEATVHDAGAVYALVGLLIIPVVYVLPQILITTEMATMMPTAHGSVMWVQRAFGDGIGFFSSLTNAISNLIDGAIYPTLFAGYICAVFYPEATKWERYGIGLVCVAAGLGICLLSARVVGHVSTFLSFAVVTPFLVGTIAGAHYVSWEKVTSSRSYLPHGHHDWGTLISAEIWLFTGWRSLGNLGEEVEGPHVFLKGMPLALGLGVVTYFFPLMVAVSIPIPPGQVDPWGSGYLATAFGVVLPGLDTAIAIAGALGNVALFSSAMLVYPRTTWGIAERGWLPSILARRSKTKSPYVALAFHCCISALLTVFDFAVLVRLETIIAAVNYVLAVTCLAVLRWKEPDTLRPFKFPKNKWASIILVSLPALTFTAVLVLNSYTNYINFLAGAGIDILVVIAWFVRKWVLENKHKWSKSKSQGKHGLSAEQVAVLEH